MADTDYLDYRLRCHTKRTDLPTDVLRDIGEAYAEIIKLQRKLADIKQGFEGCCTACEPVGALNQQLRKERDEAIAFIETVAHDVSVLSTRPAAIIKFDDLVDLINEWGDNARNILAKKDNNSV